MAGQLHRDKVAMPHKRKHFIGIMPSISQSQYLQLRPETAMPDVCNRFKTHLIINKKNPTQFYHPVGILTFFSVFIPPS